jgi:hypothetical protein
MLHLYEIKTKQQITTKFMPQLLTHQQKKNHVNVCHGLQEQLQRLVIFFEVITGNETQIEREEI